MKLLSKKGDEENWRESPGILQGLETAAAPSNLIFALYLNDPEKDIHEIGPLARMAQRLGIELDRVVFIVPHPTVELLKILAGAGASKIAVARFAGGRQEEGPRFMLKEAAETICPLLHRAGFGDRRLSVCGAHGDRMVLVPRHINEICLTKKTECPHYRIRHEN